MVKLKVIKAITRMIQIRPTLIVQIYLINVQWVSEIRTSMYFTQWITVWFPNSLVFRQFFQTVWFSGSFFKMCLKSDLTKVQISDKSGFQDIYCTLILENTKISSFQVSLEKGCDETAFNEGRPSRWHEGKIFKKLVILLSCRSL